MLHIFHYTSRRGRFLSVLLFVIPTGTQILQVLMPGKILDSIQNRQLTDALLFVGILTVGMMLFQALQTSLNSALDVEKERIRGRLCAEIGQRSVENDFEEFMSPDFREHLHFAERCINDQQAEKGFDAIIGIIGNTIALIPMLYLLASATWWLGILMVGYVIVGAACEQARSRYVFSLFASSNADDYKMLYARDRLSGRRFSKEVRLFPMYDYISTVTSRYIDILAGIQRKQAGRSFRIYTISFAAESVLTAIVLIYIAWGCKSGRFYASDFLTLSLAMLSLSETAASVARNLVIMKESSVYMQHCEKILSQVPEENTSEIPQFFSDSKVCFQSVSFSYPGSDNPAVTELSICLEAGKSYGIVGENGSGKSTFAHLLLGLINPKAGRILLDDVDRVVFSRREWEKLFSPVFQDYQVFSCTVGENICFEESIKTQPILESLDLDIDEFTELGTEHGDNGRVLSGGEGQRLALARAIYKDAPVWVLDEPSSALSPQSEKVFYDTVRRIRGDKTLILISHRLAACSLCDEILVFDGGRIIERGSHDELMRSGGKYAVMFNSQLSLYGAGKTNEDN